MILWDTAGSSEYDEMRPLSYPGTDCFIVCFSLTSKSSLESVQKKWAPEIKSNCRGAPLVLVGTKSDLRDDPSTTETVPASRAAQVQKKIGARNYVECSALTAYNLKKVRRPESPIRRNYFVDFFENIRKTN